MSITIYHNPDCGASRNTLAMIRNAAVRLCRPSAVVLDALPAAQKGALAKENGEPVIDSEGRRVRE